MEFASFRRASWLGEVGRAFLAIDDRPAEAVALEESEDEEYFEPVRKCRKAKPVLHAEEAEKTKRDRLLGSWLSVFC